MPQVTITLTPNEMECLRRQAAASGETPDGLAGAAVRDYLASARVANATAWRAELAAAIAKIHRRLPLDIAPEETEADITAAAAEAREARGRGKDGFNLLALPEHRFRALLGVARAAANLARLEEALASGAGELPLAGYGEWTWLRYLPPEDLPEFVAAVRAALIVAAREQATAALDETLRTWRSTAEELADPEARAALLGESLPEDFVEVTRPESPPS
jgi:hypothetical protein